ncbi:MAG: tRNA pseudouridine(13) synthase TruD [Planctomycetaceae bacterium]|nr:tRNA pseudouridine(13) synthase TruD [Planctomycetaceae bacterium]
MNHPRRTLPYLTHPLRGIGGFLKSSPEDFHVEEIPAYEPCGEGEFLFVRIEKRNLNTQDVLNKLARHCEVSAKQASAAGQKDRHAVTIQTICLPAMAQEKLDSFDDPDVTILSSALHRNKLKTGHLAGNRFEVTLRGIDKSLDERAFELRDLILEKGFPNYYGEQRFGHEGNTLSQGIELLQGKNPFGKMSYSQRSHLQRLCLNAVQSELFNRCLVRRLKSSSLWTVQRGDVMQVVKSGGQFVVEEEIQEEQERFDRGATAITGPMFGPKMKMPLDQPFWEEETVLAESGLVMNDFRRFKKMTPGTRRPYLIRLAELDIVREGDGLRFLFELPKGSYATSLLREFQREAADETE